MWAKNSCEEAGLFVRGIDCAERAVATTERMENPTFLVAALRSQGELMSLLGRWREARACVERAVEVASSAASWAGDAYLALAEIAMAEGNGDEVAVQVGLCSETSTRTGARGVQLRLQCLLAKKDLLDGKPALALARLDPIEQELRVGYGQWALEQTLAEARMETGDVTSAAEMVRKGIERSRRGNMRLSLAIWLRLQGMLATRQARWEDGLTALNEALALMEQMPYPYGEAEILHETGQLLAARDERDQARTPFEHALALFRRLGARPYAEKTERELAELRSRV
jgi:tetratricopeptide (TPR) repeat protein